MAKNGASNEDDRLRQRTMKALIMHVARAFYDTKYIVILDQLARHEVLKDDDLAGRVGLSSKDVSKLTGKLVGDGLVTCYRQNTSRTGETLGRITSKGYFYIDHGRFCNVVKWRIAEMRRQIDSKLRNELALQGFVCPQCRKAFQTLDIAHLVGPGGLFCDQCGGELVDNMQIQDNSGKDDRMQRFNAQTQWIRDGLKKTEDMTMPKVDIQDWIKKHPPIVPVTEGQPIKDGDGLAIAGTGPSVKQELVYDIEFTNEDSLAAEKAQREKEASLKRQQNALPAWYTRSTITGQLTAFGMKNRKYEEGYEEVQAPVEAKPVVDHEETKNTIEMYYANLEAESRASASTTPADGMDMDSPATDGFGISTPNTGQGLLVPSSSRTWSTGSSKRKRDLGDGDAMFEGSRGTPKHSRTNSQFGSQASSPPNRSKSRDSSGSETSSDIWSGDASQPGHRPTLSESGDVMMAMSRTKSNTSPMVHVNNVPIPLSEITEEHHDLMTPDEYERYFEILASQAG